MKTKEEYQKELLSPSWAAFRKGILQRDHHQCARCKNQKYLHTEATITDFSVNQTIFGNRVGLVMYSQKLNITPPKDHDIWQAIETIKSDFIKKGRKISISNSVTGFISSFSFLPQEQTSTIQALFRIAPSSKEIETVCNDSTLPDRSPDAIRLIAESEPDRITWYYVRMLNAHHTYYQEGKKAWEYPESTLTTLCLNCHQDLHTKIKVPVRDSNGQDTGLVYTPCSRCGGAGWFPEYTHVQNGICFECKGARYEELAANPF